MRVRTVEAPGLAKLVPLRCSRCGWQTFSISGREAACPTCRKGRLTEHTEEDE